MPSGSHKQTSRNLSRAERQERLAQELRANLGKRKALARARRSENHAAAPEAEEASK